MDEPDNLSGIFLGYVGTERAAVTIAIDVDDDAARVTVGVLGSDRTATVENTDRAVRWHQRMVLDRIKAEAHRNRTVIPNFKERGRKRAEPVAVVCPDCHGYRSFDCDRCEGAGVVPG